jgi:hypothetical protein
VVQQELKILLVTGFVGHHLGKQPAVASYRVRTVNLGKTLLLLILTWTGGD